LKTGNALILPEAHFLMAKILYESAASTEEIVECLSQMTDE